MNIVRTILLLVLAISFTQSKLLYMSTVFRHGARYPINNMYDGKQTSATHGNLTAIGLREHLNLGNYIKIGYIDNESVQLVNSTINPRQVQIFTLTDQTRCIESAYAHALGLFSFQFGQKIDQNIDPALLEPPFQTIFPSNLVSDEAPSQFALQKGFQPVPIRYGNIFFPKCKSQAQIFAKRGQIIAKQLAQFQITYAVFTQHISKLFNIPVAQTNIGGLVALYDTLACDYYLGRPMPSQFTDKDFQTLMFIHRYMFSIVYEDEPSRIFNAPYVNTMLENMENVIKNNLGVKKLSVYSGHDINIVPLMVFYNLTSSQCLQKLWMNQTVVGNCAIPIPFASNIFFQLHQDDKNGSNYFVKVRYNGLYFNLCGKNSTQCTYTQFAQKSRAYLLNFDKACGNTQESKKFDKIQQTENELTKIGEIIKNNFMKMSPSIAKKKDQFLNKVFSLIKW